MLIIALFDHYSHLLHVTFIASACEATTRTDVAKCAPMRFCAVQPSSTDTNNSHQPQNNADLSESAA